MPFEFGPFSISGSLVSVSGSFNITGSVQTSGSLIYLPFASGAYTTSSFGYLTSQNVGVPFLYVINGVLYYFDGSNWNQLYP